MAITLNASGGKESGRAGERAESRNANDRHPE
jgi:hypothetical protein